MKATSGFLRVLATLTLLAAAALPTAGAFARAQISAIRLGTHPDDITRIVMDVSEDIGFSTVVRTGPDRIILATGELDLLDNSVQRRAFGLIGGVQYEAGQIVIPLRQPALIKSSFTIPPREGQGWRLVVDVQKVTRAAFLATAHPATTTAVSAPAPSRAIVVYSPAVTPAVAAEPLPTQASLRTPSLLPPMATAAAEAAPVPRAVDPAPAPVVQEKPATPPVPEPAPSRPRTTATGAPLLSAPVPPPLARPVVEVASSQTTAALPEDKTTAATSLAAVTMAPPAPPRTPRNEGKPVVVIDPGHGGVDPGALGVSGIYEKHITLAMARELKNQLERTGRYKVHLTRDRDIFIRLRERVAIARQFGADLFISLHADSVNNPQLAGLSVYTLSQTASDGEAQLLADKENKADLIAGIDLSHESADVANILIDLAQRESMNRSASFAGGVVDELGRETALLGNTHRFAGFAVLKAPDVPSILVELGYLSNPSEERQLRQPDYRSKLAKGISRAVDHYFLDGQKARRP